MNTVNHRVSGHKAGQVFKFSITGGLVTQATATILAENIDVAWKMIHALFPGSGLSEVGEQDEKRGQSPLNPAS